jgi:tRNA(Arg) A34 adenosine deaminase TadA
MRLVFCLVFFISAAVAIAQPNTAPDSSYFITHNRQAYLQKLVDLQIGITENDKTGTILRKLKNFLNAYVPEPGYADDRYAKAANLQALKSVLEGGYGIGAVLIDEKGKIIWRGHNNQLQRNRSDLHGEMDLLSSFESKAALAKPYMHKYTYKKGMLVFSSAEPCPMCFIRLASAGVATRYCTPGPDDGMVNRINCLPQYWKELAQKSSFAKGQSSPMMQRLAHLLFFSYLLDGRGPE